MSRYNLTHLKQLEAESIHIIREVAAEFDHPVMLYSIGKDSSVLARLAQKAFAPAPLPFPLLHIDTTWKFREMIAFRDKTVRDFGLELITYTNQDGLARNVRSHVDQLGDCHHFVRTDIVRAGFLRARQPQRAFDAFIDIQE